MAAPIRARAFTGRRGRLDDETSPHEDPQYPEPRQVRGSGSLRRHTRRARSGTITDQLFDTPEPPRGRTSVPPSEGPLAVRMRPASLDDFVGQEHLLAPGSALRTAIETGRPHSMFLYGPPGSG